MGKIKVAIIMGSDSDSQVMNEAASILEKFAVSYEMKVLSAHRTPKDTIAYAACANKRGMKVIIAGAGGAAHLAGIVAAHTLIPVIGVPMETQHLKGIDSLFSTVQMPSGVPVGCMAIGKAGAKNAALFAVEILALSDKNLYNKLKKYRKDLTEAARRKGI